MGALLNLTNNLIRRIQFSLFRMVVALFSTKDGSDTVGCDKTSARTTHAAAQLMWLYMRLSCAYKRRRLLAVISGADSATCRRRSIARPLTSISHITVVFSGVVNRS